MTTVLVAGMDRTENQFLRYFAALGWGTEHRATKTTQRLPKCDVAIIVTTHCSHELQWEVKEEYKGKPIFYAKEGMSSIKDEFEKKFIDPIVAECTGKAKTAAIRWFIATTRSINDRFSKSLLTEWIKANKLTFFSSSDFANCFVDMVRKGEVSVSKDVFPVKYTYNGITHETIKEFRSRGFKNLDDLTKNVKQSPADQKKQLLSLDDLKNIKIPAAIVPPSIPASIENLKDIKTTAAPISLNDLKSIKPVHTTVATPTQEVKDRLGILGKNVEVRKAEPVQETPAPKSEAAREKETTKELSIEMLAGLETEISQLRQSFSSLKSGLESAISLLTDLTTDFAKTKTSLTDKVENLKTHMTTDLNLFIARTDLISEQIKRQQPVQTTNIDITKFATKEDLSDLGHELVSIFEMAKDLSKLDEKTREKVKKIIDLML